MQQTSF
nr:unnamed protein product [Callosobruchus chinensis]